MTDHLPSGLRDLIPDLVRNHREKAQERFGDRGEELLMYSGVLLNWVGEWLTDPGVQWEKRVLQLDALTLTGTNPAWNAVILDRAQREPRQLRELLRDPAIARLFDRAQWLPVPILARVDPQDKGKLKVLDGMKRTIAAIRDGHDTIEAWVATRPGVGRPRIEAHVIYDLLRAAQQGRGSRDDLRAALRFLLQAYGNTRDLLEHRFSAEWVRDPQLQMLVREVLAS